MPEEQQQVNQQAAEDTVFENLGLSKEDLGVTDPYADEGAGDSGIEEQQQPQQDFEPPPAKDDLSRQPQQGVRPDNKGNFVDANGRVLARAGAEARLYKTAHQAKQQADRATRERDEINTRLNKAIEIGQELYRENEQLRARDEQFKSLGLEPHELLDAAQLAAEAKRNPGDVIKKLLTRAAASGMDLSSLGLQGGVDPKSLLDMVRTEITNLTKPVQERTAREQQEERQRREEQQASEQVQREVQAFFTDNPQARPYVAVFQAVLRQPQFQHMTLGEVWARIQLNLLKTQRGQNGTQRRPSLPNGRGAVPVQNAQPIASPDKSYDEIIRDIIR